MTHHTCSPVRPFMGGRSREVFRQQRSVRRRSAGATSAVSVRQHRSRIDVCTDAIRVLEVRFCSVRGRKLGGALL